MGKIKVTPRPNYFSDRTAPAGGSQPRMFPLCQHRRDEWAGGLPWAWEQNEALKAAAPPWLVPEVPWHHSHGRPVGWQAVARDTPRAPALSSLAWDQGAGFSKHEENTSSRARIQC